MLAIEQQLDDAGSQGAIASMNSSTGLGSPNKQASYGMPTVKRIEQTSDLVTIPDVTALELRQRHMAIVNMIKYR